MTWIPPSEALPIVPIYHKYVSKNNIILGPLEKLIPEAGQLHPLLRTNWNPDSARVSGIDPLRDAQS